MSALQQVRQQLQQARIQHEQEQPLTRPRTREEFDAYLDSLPKASAESSIARAHALFDRSYKRQKIRRTYDGLTVKQRAMCCIAGGLSPDHANQSFDQLNDIQRQKVRKGLELMDSVTKRFEGRVGNVSQLAAPDFL
ncbi:hypothetical protein [Vibrio metschnikovii]|uniref:hypothetical protein n=1 Tax=Vibrio metschnikovii TaxID=28172 RepID=UPI001C306F08|nr:hypothetical protein [Vibrio metschnikovii]